MIQTSTFALSKDIARLPFGIGGGANFYYLGDLRSQWESSNLSSKVLELIGSESVPFGHLPAIKERLGRLAEEEADFVADGTAFMRDVGKLVSTLPFAVDPEPDLLETILDTRVLAAHVRFPCRVLDIGPGAGRHMLNAALRPAYAGGVYCGVDSIGLPYALQNMMASALSLRNPAITATDTLDFEFARREVAMPDSPEPNSIWHAPLWHADKLPGAAFDLILCNYVLDEVPAPDFHRIVGLIARCLAPEGVVYCRGGQQKSMLRDLQLFGFGTYHQQDITASLLNCGLQVKSCRLDASTLTRILVRRDSRTHHCVHDGAAVIANDVPLVEAVQREFLRDNLTRIRDRQLRTLIWSGPGHAAAERYLGGALDGVALLGVTSDQIAQRQPGLFGLTEYPLAEIAGLEPQAVIIADMRYRLAVRELIDNLRATPPNSVLSFNYPLAFAYF